MDPGDPDRDTNQGKLPVKGFPESVRRAMLAEGTAVTCLPVQLDGGGWESALFFHLGGEESLPDREALLERSRPIAVGLETDVMKLDNAAVVMLRAEAHTRDQDPLVGEVLLVPGETRAHFDALQLLSEQTRLSWFFADTAFRVIHGQEHPLESEHREELGRVLREAVEHDALVRFTGRYDAGAALAEVTAHYAARGNPAPDPEGAH